MFGVLLISISQFFSEVSDSIVKAKGQRDESLLYTLGFLQLAWGFLLFLSIALFKSGGFVFSMASLPTFLTRAVLEVLQSHFTLLAIMRADRSSFGFLRVGTIPLLLLVDFVLSYTVKGTQVAGIGLIVFSFVLIFAGRQVQKSGAGLVAFITLNAVVSISLFKYDITHYNSLAAEQLLIAAIILLYFLFVIIFLQRRNPLAYLKNRLFLVQSLAAGAGYVMDSYAYVFAPASVILAAKRGAAVLWATISGNMYFRETNLLFKLAVAIMLTGGIVLLAV
ncbi:MAG: hypothetical protein UY65_C0005G0009 [Parcubacteria group bacterium GW2011_GWA2_51_12]|nr:MAG: hypothetical protein UY65_C0005G0009 [Parcubacteria group bacterium GW2011_GWA2_51_12]